MVIPDRDPRVVLVGSEKIEIGAVGCEALAVVVEGGDDAFGLGDAVDAVAVAVVTVAGVLVDVVTKVDDVVDRVLSYGVSIGVEKAEGCLVLVGGWRSQLGAAYGSCCTSRQQVRPRQCSRWCQEQSWCGPKDWSCWNRRR